MRQEPRERPVQKQRFWGWIWWLTTKAKLPTRAKAPLGCMLRQVTTAVPAAQSAFVSDPRAILGGMAAPDPKADLTRYLRIARDALLWKLEGLSEYDVRRPMVPTGTNLLGAHRDGLEAVAREAAGAGP